MITRDASGEVRELEFTDSDKPYVYIAANGVLETGYVDPDSGAADSFSYSFATDDLLPLQPWSGREGEQITTDADGEELNRIPFSFRTRGATTIDIGGCRYAMVPLETYYFEPGDPSMVEFAYLTELAVPISVGYSYLAGGMGTAETSTPIGIRPVRERE